MYNIKKRPYFKKENIYLVSKEILNIRHELTGYNLPECSLYTLKKKGGKSHCFLGHFECIRLHVPILSR